MQMNLIHETLTDALRDVVQAAGGNKKVGAQMYPEMPADLAAQRIRDCLNPERREIFNPEQVLFLLRMGRQCGCHAAINHISHEAGYSAPQPVEPEDEVARLQREFVEATKTLGALASHIERIQKGR